MAEKSEVVRTMSIGLSDSPTMLAQISTSLSPSLTAIEDSDGYTRNTAGDENNSSIEKFWNASHNHT